jgi:hypothetical protein
MASVSDDTPVVSDRSKKGISMSEAKKMDQEKLELIEILVNEFSERQKNAENPEEKAALGRQVLQYRFLPRRVLDAAAGDVIVPPALIRLQHERGEFRVFLVPGGGGQVLHHAGHPVQVLTPQSPLGDALLGKPVGASFELVSGGSVRRFQVLGFC